jgi:hypothetical protein
MIICIGIYIDIYILYTAYTNICKLYVHILLSHVAKWSADLQLSKLSTLKVTISH